MGRVIRDFEAGDEAFICSDVAQPCFPFICSVGSLAFGFPGSGRSQGNIGALHGILKRHWIFG
jgi:hypothetical protein